LPQRVSWFNKGEVDIVVEVVKSLIAEAQTSVPSLRPEEIGIMAPWREQVRLLREELRTAGFHAVDVGTVEVGRRSFFVLFSCEFELEGGCLLDWVLGDCGS
jgi:hypothetical protein